MKRWEMVQQALKCAEYYAKRMCSNWKLNPNDEMNIPPTANSICLWVIDEDGIWSSTCDQHFQFEDDGPKANGFKFCPYCSNTLVEDETAPEDENGGEV